MKFLSFAKVFAFTIFLTAAAVLNAPAQANSGNNNSFNDNTRPTPARTVERTTTVRENDTDWGWLGLLGLAGLAGLIPKKRHVEVHDNRTVRDDRTTGTTTDTTTNRNTNV
jgi:MYXO-CTERM domain-containing protein